MSLHPQGRDRTEQTVSRTLSHQHSFFYFLTGSPKGVWGLGNGAGERVTVGTPSNTCFPLRKTPGHALPPAPPCRSSEAFARSLGRGTDKAAGTLLFSWGGGRDHRGQSSPCPGTGSRPGLLCSSLADPPGASSQNAGWGRGSVHGCSSHMQWASSAVPQKANTDASEAIVLPAALSPPSDPVGMMFPGLC